VSAAHFAAFLGVSLTVILTPGQDTALTIRNTLMGGRRSGVWTAVGVVSGQLVWAVVSSVGLAAVLLASQPAFMALRLVGAAYLVFLGAQALVSAVRGHSSEAAVAATGQALSSRRAYRQGLLSNLGNPKMAIFFTSLLPQFATGEATFWTMLALGVVFASITLAWLAGYAVAVSKAQSVLRGTGFRRALDAVTGTVLVAFGLRLAAER
jgi:threonine/homoserine/homoserine lactone efflux protein